MQMLVLGMHRSGTSAVARLLNMMGAYFSPEYTSGSDAYALPPTEANPKGYWERRDVMLLNDALLNAIGVRWDQITEYHSDKFTTELFKQHEWTVRKIIAGLDAHRPWMMKDPRLCLTFPAWERLLEIPVCVCVYRSPVQIAQSLHTRENLPLHYGVALWEKYTLNMLQHAKPHPTVLVSYHDLMRDPVTTVQKLYADLEQAGVQALRLPADKEINAFITPSLHRAKGDEDLQQGYINQQQRLLSQAFANGDILTWETIPSLSVGAEEILRTYETQVLDLQQQQQQAEQLQSEVSHLNTKLSTQQQAAAHTEQQLQQQLQQQAQQFNAHLQDLNSHLEQQNQQMLLIEQERNEYRQRWQSWDNRLQASEATLQDKQQLTEEQAQQIDKLKADLQKQVDISKKLNYWVHALQHDIKLVFDSLTWKIGDFVRVAALKLTFRRMGATAQQHIERLLQDFQNWKNYQNDPTVVGPSITSTPQPVVTTRKRRVKEVKNPENPHDYARWFNTFDILDSEEIKQMQNCLARWHNPPLVSIVMPTYNSNEIFLRRAIDSVVAQVYTNWELCIADDASTQAQVRRVLEDYQARDARIKVTFRSENGHISAASNSALATASGEFIALMDHDDLLPRHALFWMVEAVLTHPDGMIWYSDEDKINESDERYDAYFKPDWNPDLFLSYNLINHFALYRASLLHDIGGFREGYEGAQDYDLALRAVERIQPQQIHHVPRVLYHWRAISGSTAVGGEEKPYALVAAQKVLTEHLARQGISATVSEALELSGANRVRYHLPDNPPRISLIIPTYNGLKVLKCCVDSILAKTDYPNYEIVIVDNNSDDAETLQYFAALEQAGKARIIKHPYPFNYSAINNAAVKQVDSELIGLLNNDLEVISPDWLTEMVSHTLRPSVGAVGARLWYPDDRLQHGGVITGLGGVAGHSHKYFPRGNSGYFGRTAVIQNYSAVTAACLILRREVYTQVGGLDAENLKVAFNDVDFCLRIGEAGYRIVWTPYADLYHHESATRGQEDTPEKQARFKQEIDYMQARWKNLLFDPAYSPNLTLNSEDFAFSWSGPRVPIADDILNKQYPPRPTSGPVASAVASVTPSPVPQVTTPPPSPAPLPSVPAAPPKPVAASVIPTIVPVTSTASTPSIQHRSSHLTLLPHAAHRADGMALLNGHGLELGAFNQPAVLPERCTLEYADALTPQQAIELFPELSIQDIMPPDHIVNLDKEGLSLFDSGQFDFVVCNHVLEHIANPLKILGELFRVVKPQGHVVVSVPDKRFTSDKDRPLTTFSHLLREYKDNVTEVTDAHYFEFLQSHYPTLVNAVAHDDELKPHLDKVRQRREHAHVWDSASFAEFMQQALVTLHLQATCVYLNQADDNQFEYFAVWQKS